jgi:sulfur carrier protein
MEIRLNGRPEHIPDSQPSLAALLQRLGMAGKPVLVEINAEALLASQQATVVLHEGDVVELIRIAQGG